MLSSYMQFFIYDRLGQILDFGEVFPRQASTFESNSKGFKLLKTYLAVSLWTQCFGKNKSNTIENTAEVRPVAGGAKPPRNGSFSFMLKDENEKIPKNESP